MCSGYEFFLDTYSRHGVEHRVVYHKLISNKCKWNNSTQLYVEVLNVNPCKHRDFVSKAK